MKLRSLFLAVILLVSSNFSYATGKVSLDDYFNQVNRKSPYQIPVQLREDLKNYYQKHKLGPNRVLNEHVLDIKRDEFNTKRISLIKQWVQNTNANWPTYENDTLCKINGECYWKHPGHLYDAHHIIPLSHGGPNIWQNIWPLATNDHTALHAKPGPCCSIFPNSCGYRGGDIDTSDYFKGWTLSGKSRSRVINGKDVMITKVKNDSKHYYRIRVGNIAGGSSYDSLLEAQKAAIANALSD